MQKQAPGTLVGWSIRRVHCGPLGATQLGPRTPRQRLWGSSALQGSCGLRCQEEPERPLAGEGGPSSRECPLVAAPSRPQPTRPLTRLEPGLLFSRCVLPVDHFATRGPGVLPWGTRTHMGAALEATVVVKQVDAQAGGGHSGRRPRREEAAPGAEERPGEGLVSGGAGAQAAGGGRQRSPRPCHVLPPTRASSSSLGLGFRICKAGLMMITSGEDKIRQKLQTPGASVGEWIPGNLEIESKPPLRTLGQQSLWTPLLTLVQCPVVCAHTVVTKQGCRKEDSLQMAEGNPVGQLCRAQMGFGPRGVRGMSQ